MSDTQDKNPQAQSSKTRPDPRLLPADTLQQTPLAFYGRLAGWTGIALLVVALSWAGVAKSLPLPVKVIGVLAIVCLVLWLYVHIHQLIIMIRTRGAQAALSSALFTVFVLGILVLVNYIGGRHHLLRHDFTQSKMHSLSDQSRSILKTLDTKVTLTAFISQEYHNAEPLRRLLDEYGYASSKVAVRIHDFKTDVDKVQEYNVRFDGTLYVEAGEKDAVRKEEVQGGTEEQITSALLAVTTGEKTKIYFLTGHGEASVEAAAEGSVADGRAVSMLKSILENQQYEVESLSLLTMKPPQVPSEGKLLVIAGAKFAPSQAEMGAISRFVDQGGNLLLMLEPSPAPDFAELLQPHGVTPLPGKVTDPASSAEGQPEILATMAQSHDTTRGLSYIILPTARAFAVEAKEPPPAMPGAPPPPTDQSAVALLKTSEAAKTSGDTATSGPLTVAVAIDPTPAKPQQVPGMPPEPESDEGRKARLAVIGDSDFCTDQLIPVLGGYGRQNLAFAAMTINWLLKNDKLVSIPPKQPADKPFSATDPQRRLINLITAGVVPLLIVIAGIAVWWLRRRV